MTECVRLLNLNTKKLLFSPCQRIRVLMEMYKKNDDFERRTRKGIKKGMKNVCT